MKCLELQELFALEALGALDRVGQARLHALLAADSDAAAEAPAWRDAVAAFAAASAPRRRAPAHLRERILTRIGRTPQLRPGGVPLKTEKTPVMAPEPNSTPMPPSAVPPLTFHTGSRSCEFGCSSTGWPLLMNGTRAVQILPNNTFPLASLRPAVSCTV